MSFTFLFLYFLFRYFEDEGEDLENLEYQPAPGSPSADRNVDNSPASSDSDDPLEAFMTGIKVCKLASRV